MISYDCLLCFTANTVAFLVRKRGSGCVARKTAAGVRKQESTKRCLQAWSMTLPAGLEDDLPAHRESFTASAAVSCCPSRCSPPCDAEPASRRIPTAKATNCRTPLLHPIRHHQSSTAANTACRTVATESRVLTIPYASVSCRPNQGLSQKKVFRKGRLMFHKAYKAPAPVSYVDTGLY